MKMLKKNFCEIEIISRRNIAQPPIVFSIVDIWVCISSILQIFIFKGVDVFFLILWNFRQMFWKICNFAKLNFFHFFLIFYGFD